ncbi:MAG: hypothetical protein KC516_03540 [Nanoarchaeota archaeon]|nr:hypothetical protein [Nanoarchaeota archaeon]
MESKKSLIKNFLDTYTNHIKRLGDYHLSAEDDGSGNLLARIQSEKEPSECLKEKIENEVLPKKYEGLKVQIGYISFLQFG